MIISYTVPEIWCVTNIIVIFHFGLLFALLRTRPPRPPTRKSKFQKNEKMPGDTIILHLRTKNHD